MIELRNEPSGGLANKMFQYMYLSYLRTLIPQSTIHNVQLDEFGLSSPDIVLEGRVLHINGGNRHNMQSIAYLLRERIYDNLNFGGSVLRLEYYPSRAFCSDLFKTESSLTIPQVSDENILINIRGAEILAATHPDYGPVPVDFLSQVAEQTKLSPIIMGQVGNDEYSAEIKRRFSGCPFLPSISPLSDFELIRRAKNICISVSTFSWLAAWLSSGSVQIHMPVSGFYNPLQRRDIDLLPVNDTRYSFYEFPVEKWSATSDQKARLIAKGQYFRRLTNAEARLMIN